MNKTTSFKNPFDEKTETERSKFFREMTDAINEWMLEKYPQFDSRLSEKISILEKETNLVVGRLRSLANEHEKTFIEKAKREINQFLDDKFPGMAKRFSEATQDAERLVKSLKQKEEKTCKVLSKLSKSDALHEDVYRLRDEMKAINRFLGDFKHKMQVLFK
jgi:hypothetical protein